MSRPCGSPQRCAQHARMYICRSAQHDQRLCGRMRSSTERLSCVCTKCADAAGWSKLRLQCRSRSIHMWRNHFLCTNAAVKNNSTAWPWAPQSTIDVSNNRFRQTVFCCSWRPIFCSNTAVELRHKNVYAISGLFPANVFLAQLHC